MLVGWFVFLNERGGKEGRNVVSIPFPNLQELELYHHVIWNFRYNDLYLWIKVAGAPEGQESKESGVWGLTTILIIQILTTIRFITPGIWTARHNHSNNIDDHLDDCFYYNYDRLINFVAVVKFFNLNCDHTYISFFPRIGTKLQVLKIIWTLKACKAVKALKAMKAL